MTWQITLNHVCAVLYDISLLAQAYRCMQMLPQTLLFKSAAWHGTFDMIISHLSDLTSPSSDRRCQRRWEMMATLNMNPDMLWWNAEKQTTDCYLMLFNKGRVRGEIFLPLPRSHGCLIKCLKHWTKSLTVSSNIREGSCWECGCSFHAVQLISNRSQPVSVITAAQMALQSAPCKEWIIIITHNLPF